MPKNVTMVHPLAKIIEFAHNRYPCLIGYIYRVLPCGSHDSFAAHIYDLKSIPMQVKRVPHFRLIVDYKGFRGATLYGHHRHIGPRCSVQESLRQPSCLHLIPMRGLARR